MEYREGAILVRFERGTTERQIDDLLGRADASEEERVPKLGVRSAEVDAAGGVDEALALLNAAPGVVYAERDAAVEAFDIVPDDTLWKSQWGPELIDAPAAWTVTRGSPNVVVAVLDSGVDADHPDLRGSLVPGHDFVNGDADASDDFGHGTSVAGIVAARSANRLGTAGICWKCAIMPVKVLDSAGFGSTSTVAAGLVWAVDNGADVVNLSLGTAASMQTLADAVAYAASKGVVVVAAAGNSGSPTPLYPAAHAGVISVAGTNRSEQLFPWSNYGPWVLVAAPGCNVAPLMGGGYGDMCGTSAAAPLVAGIAALELAARPGSSPAAIAAALESKTVAVPRSPLANGRVDADAALRKITSAASTPQSPAAAPATAAPPAQSAPAPIAPANVDPPTVAGTPRVGELLSARTGRWSPAPEGFTYRWERCDAVGASCSPIGTGAGVEYRVAAEDTNFSLRVVVSARGAGGTRAVNSAAVGPVSVDGPANLTPPGIAVATRGTERSLKALEGSWSGAPTRFGHQWQSCRSEEVCADISGATKQTYTPPAGAPESKFRVVVLAENGTGSATAASPTVERRIVVSASRG